MDAVPSTPPSFAQTRLSVLPLAPSRSAVIRLRPVVDALLSSASSGTIVDTASFGALVDCRGASELTSAVEEAVARVRPTVALLAGDGDDVVTCALAAARLGVPIARVGAGLRCRDRGALDEVNRIVLDGLAARLYADTEESLQNLLDGGAAPDSILCVGSTLADAVERLREPALERAAWRDLGFSPGEYLLVAVQHPDNVGLDERLLRFVAALVERAKGAPLVLCVAADTRLRLQRLGQLARLTDAGVRVIEPVPHVDFLSLEAGAGAVITDSAGVQEETSVLGVQCFTLRYSTECVATLIHGTNTLLGEDPAEMADVETEPSPRRPARVPHWDGAAGTRIADDLLRGHG